VTAPETSFVSKTGEIPDFGLSTRALQLLRDLFAAEPAVQRVIVYGSRAMGNFRRGSDIDLALDAPSMDYGVFMRMRTRIDDLMLPWEVDLALISHIDNPDLLAHIARVGKPLWVRGDIFAQ
jgi:predicted nucleotidyltransferase